MKTKLIFLVLLLSVVGILAQQKAKVQKSDESGFIEVDEVPVLISKIKPSYPEIARLAGIEGTVYLKVLVDENGNVEKAKVEQGAKEILDNSALQAAQKAKFSPAMLNNKPVKVWVVLPIAFKLDADKKEEARVLKYSELGPPPSNAKVGDPDINDFVLVEKYPEMIKSETPEYPEIAKRAGITGKVFVKVLVDKNGSPKKAIVIKSDSELLNQSAVDAALKTKFSPAIQKGEAIAVWIVLPYKFSLGDETKVGKKQFDTVELAKDDYKANIYMYERMENREAIGAPKNMKFEKMEKQIPFGDESALYKVTSEKKTGFSFIAREGRTVYKYSAPTLEDIQKYVDEDIPNMARIISTKENGYPAAAFDNKLEGKVILKAIFNKDDKSITKLDLIEGTHEILNKGAIEYVKKNLIKLIEGYESVRQKYYKQRPKEVQEPREIKDTLIITVLYQIEE